MKILILLLLANFPAGILEDRNGDGVTDYVNAKIYVADDPTPSELSAAANIAARLAFESLSIDLPIGFPISSFSTNDTSVAIVVGRAASRFAGGQSEGVIDSTDGTRRVIAIPSVLEAEEWAASLEIPQPEPGEEAEEEEVEGEEEEDTSDKPVDENLGAKSYSLARLYTPDGLFGDSDKNFIPDTMETTIYLGPDTSSIRVIDLGARIGLETTGLRLPLVVVADEEQTPQNPVLIGMTNPHVRKLIEDEKFSPSLRGGQGRVEVVVNAFKKDHRALVLVGGDAPGEDRVIEHVAERLPYAWDYGKDNLHLVKIEDDLRRFFSLRSPEAQASAALYKARRMAAKLEGKDLEFAELKVFIERGGDEVLEHIRNEFPSFTVTAANIDVMSAEPVFEETFSIPWEVADVREMISSKLLAEVHSGAAVRLEVRVSESPEIRAQLHTELRDALLGRGADPENTEVRVLSAYKQGYSWINDILKPQLGNASEIKIYFRELEPEGWQTIESPIRWLQELFPVDEVLARDLDIPLENITFEKTTAGPIYRVEAEDSEGRRFLNESFDPQFVFRPMFDKFPQYEQVRVTTGWVHARIDGLTLLDERVKTDPERFWDEFQQRVFGQIHDYVLELYEGKPRARWAPYFGALEVDLWMSEPNYRIGIDEEQISSLEAVHEDIFFETLLFFDLIGQYYAGERLTYPGRVIPRIRPSREGTAGTARIRFTGKQGPNPRVDLEFRERGKLKQRWTEDFWPVNIEAPKIVAETVRTGHEGVVALEFLQQTDSEENQRDELITKARGEAIDRTLLSSEQAAAMVENIQEFHDLGFGTRWLSYDGVDEIRVRFRTTDDVESQASVSRTAEGYYRVPKMEASQPSDEPIVQWDNPINTTETEQIISELASFPEVRPFYTTSSYSRETNLGDGRHVTICRTFLLPGKGVYNQAGPFHHRTATRQRGLEHISHFEARRVAHHRPGLQTDPGSRELYHPPDHKSRRRRPGLRTTGNDSRLHAARRLPGFPRRGCHLGSVEREPDVSGDKCTKGPLGDVAAGYRSQSARVPLTRMGPAFCRLQRVGPIPDPQRSGLVGAPGLVHAGLQLYSGPQVRRPQNDGLCHPGPHRRGHLGDRTGTERKDVQPSSKIRRVGRG